MPVACTFSRERDKFGLINSSELFVDVVVVVHKTLNAIVGTEGHTDGQSVDEEMEQTRTRSPRHNGKRKRERERDGETFEKAMQ